MNLRSLFSMTLLGFVCLRAAEDPAAAERKALTEYGERLRQATEQLNQTRQRIAGEKEPLLKSLHAAEERISGAESETNRLELAREDWQNRHRQLQKEREALQKNLNYDLTLLHEGLAAVIDGQAPGEEQVRGEPLRQALQQLDEGTKVAPDKAGLAALEQMVSRLETVSAGAQASGHAIVAETNEVVEGRFVFFGPDSFFRSTDGKLVGVAKNREGTVYPILHTLPDWKPSEAEAFFEGKPGGVMMADSTGGKALRLKEAKGTFLEHLHRGGVVSYAILAVGFLSVLLILNKIVDLSRLQVDEPKDVDHFLKKLLQAPPERRKQMLLVLGSTTHELFAAGVEHMGRPKQILEEHLWAALMRIRLHYERRLPLLSVIAVAAPLMGLLGTVTGMVRTFALITVFGTGNAGKLASGISEVLVSTELGLIVAIPTLVAHGFLSNRIHKKIALLERYALEFTTAAKADDVEAPRKEKADVA